VALNICSRNNKEKSATDYFGGVVDPKILMIIGLILKLSEKLGD
jgi:hypothetical protein